MKRFVYILLIIVLLVAFSFVFLGCDMISMTANTPENEDTEPEEEEPQEEEEEEEEDNTQYVELINDLLDNIHDDNYLNALSLLLENIPISQIALLVQPYIGEENTTLLTTYYQDAVTLLPMMRNLLPIIEQIKPNLSKSDIIMNGVLSLIGAQRIDENTFTFQNYTIFFGENNYIITKDNDQYTLDYTTNYRFMSCEKKDVEEETTDFVVESNCINDDFAFQYYDYENQKLVQILLQAATLEATVSLQENIQSIPYGIENGITSEFATEGNLLYFDKFDLLEFVAVVE